MLAITMIVIIGKETDTLVKRLPGNWHMTHSQDVIHIWLFCCKAVISLALVWVVGGLEVSVVWLQLPLKGRFTGTNCHAEGYSVSLLKAFLLQVCITQENWKHVHTKFIHECS